MIFSIDHGSCDSGINIQLISYRALTLMLIFTNRGEVRRFSTASTTPSLVAIPIAVDPSFIASVAYSTAIQSDQSQIR
jgi:hypothetical protein